MKTVVDRAGIGRAATGPGILGVQGYVALCCVYLLGFLRVYGQY